MNHYCYPTKLVVYLLLTAVGTLFFGIPCYSQLTNVSAICVTSDGQLLSGSDDGFQKHDLKTLKAIENIETTLEKLYSIKPGLDNQIAIAGGTPAELGVIEIYSLPGFERTGRFECFDDMATDVAWISKNHLIACSMSGECCLLTFEKGEVIKRQTMAVHSKGILAVEVLRDGMVISCSLDSTIRAWDHGHPKQARVLNNHADIVNGVAKRTHSDSVKLEMIASVSDDRTIRFWQPKIGRMVRFAKLDSIPTCVIWKQDGSIAIAGCRDGSIVSVDSETARLVSTTRGSGWINCLALTEDEGHVLVGGEHGISRIDLNAQEN